MPPELTPTDRSDIMAAETMCRLERWGNGEEGEEETREAMREETTIAAEEERPEPVGTVPFMRRLRDGIEGGELWYFRWPR